MLITPLRSARKKADLTLQDVAAKIGGSIDTGNLSRIERGKQVPSPEKLEKLVELFSLYGITEAHILFPQRYMVEDNDSAPDCAETTAKNRGVLS